MHVFIHSCTWLINVLEIYYPHARRCKMRLIRLIRDDAWLLLGLYWDFTSYQHAWSFTSLEPPSLGHHTNHQHPSGWPLWLVETSTGTGWMIHGRRVESPVARFLVHELVHFNHLKIHLLLLIWFLKITWNLLVYQIPCYGESWWTNQDSEKGNSFQKVLSAKRSWQSLASPNSKTWRSPECLRFWASDDGSWKKRCFCLFQIFSRVFAAVLREPSRAQSCVMCLVNGKEWQGCFFGCFYGDHWPCHRIKGVASPKPFSKVFKSHQSQGCSYIQ